MKVAAASPFRQPIAGILAALALGASCLLPAKAEVFVNYNYTLWGSTGFFDPVEGPARRAALESVVNYMLGQFSNLQNGRTLNISIAPDNTAGQLAGASVQFAGSPNTYVDTAMYRNLVLGINTGGGGSDVNLFVNFDPSTGPDWYVGTGTPGPTQVDFHSVLLHELTHGLGISAKINSNGSSNLGSNRYPRFSSYLQRGDGSR